MSTDVYAICVQYCALFTINSTSVRELQCVLSSTVNKIKITLHNYVNVTRYNRVQNSSQTKCRKYLTPIWRIIRQKDNKYRWNGDINRLWSEIKTCITDNAEQVCGKHITEKKQKWMTTEILSHHSLNIKL